MKLTRERLDQIIKEELEQEGFFGNLKAKIAPGMAAKSVAKSFGPMFTVNHEGAIEIVPAYAMEVNSGPDGKPDIKRIIDMVFRDTSDMIQDENFQALPEESKTLILKYNKAAKEGKTSGSQAVVKLAPPGSEFRNVIQNIISGKHKEMSAKAAAADKEMKASAAAAKDREEKERRLRNDYESRKNAKLDAELASKKDKERADQEFRTSQREPDDSRAARPYDGRVSSYSSAPTGNVRDAWEESKKSNKNIVKEGKNMKLTRERLDQIIKEELEQEGILDTVKGRLAPGMVADKLAKRYKFFQAKNGRISINPDSAKDLEYTEAKNQLIRQLRSMVGDPAFQGLPETPSKKKLEWLSTQKNYMTGALSSDGKPPSLEEMPDEVREFLSNAKPDPEPYDYDREEQRKDAARELSMRAQFGSGADVKAMHASELGWRAHRQDRGERLPESKKSSKNIVKEGKNMKLTKDRLKQIIKEELEEMMGEVSTTPAN